MSDLNEAELKALDALIDAARKDRLPEKLVRIKIKNVARDAGNFVDKAAKVAAVAAAVAAVTAAKIPSLQMEIEGGDEDEGEGETRIGNISLEDLIQIREEALSRRR